jgi:hypothetical protein
MKIVRRVLGGLLALGILYLGCLLFPQPFFRSRTSQGNITLYAAGAPPSDLLPEVSRLLSRSTLDDPGLHHRVFVCGGITQFGFFTRGRSNLGGLCDTRLTRNVFIHPADLDKERLLAPPGWPYGSDNRPLSYFIAHEITHSLESHWVGRWSLKDPLWLWEGYADYIANGTDSLETYLDRYRRGSPIMDPARGLYDRYALYVAYLLEYEHRDIRDLLNHPPAEDSIKTAISRLAISPL